MIQILGIFLIALAVGIVLYFSIRIFLYWWNWHKLSQLALNIRTGNLGEILNEIERIGTESPSVEMLVASNELSADEKYELTISENIDSPWSGKSVSFHIADDINASFADSVGINQLGRKVFVSVLVPKIKLKNAKLQNVWSTSKYLQLSPKIKEIVKEIPEEHQADVLRDIIGSYISVGGGLNWLQSPEFPYCSICNKRMTFILQIPGILFPSKVKFDVKEAEIYFFGCENHPKTIQKVIQYD